MLPGGFLVSGEWPSCLWMRLTQLFYEQVPHLPEQLSAIEPLTTKPNLSPFVCVYVCEYVVCALVCPCPSICLSIPPSVLPVSVVMV